MYLMKTISQDWIFDRPGRRLLPFTQRVKAASLKKGDRVLLFVSGRRRIVGAVQLTGTTESTGKLSEAEREKYGYAVPCRTLALVEVRHGIRPARFGLKGPNGRSAWRPIDESTFMDVLAELSMRQRKEAWNGGTAA
jgi:hypothetical protein